MTVSWWNIINGGNHDCGKQHHDQVTADAVLLMKRMRAKNVSPGPQTRGRIVFQNPVMTGPWVLLRVEDK